MNQPQTVGELFAQIQREVNAADYERKRKVCLIEDIYKVQRLLNYPEPTGNSFDYLYDQSYLELARLYDNLRQECLTKLIDAGPSIKPIG